MRTFLAAVYLWLMEHRRPALVAVAALLLAIGGVLAVLASGPPARAATTTLCNASYNGSLAPGATAKVGFTATYSGSNSPPSAVACSA